MKGGTRPGAGRPFSTKPPPTKPLAIRLSDVHREKFKELGGILWLRRLLDEAGKPT